MRQLAQVNIAKMVAPLDDPVMAGFVGQLEAVNAIADGSPGFVWRLQDDGGDATSVRVFDDDTILVNMSVWESTAALHGYVYRSGHGPALRDRAKWFVRMPEAHLAMWWIDAGEKPTVEQAVERLLFLRAHGETPSRSRSGAPSRRHRRTRCACSTGGRCARSGAARRAIAPVTPSSPTPWTGRPCARRIGAGASAPDSCGECRGTASWRRATNT
jgi:hypothetical protein